MSTTCPRESEILRDVRSGSSSEEQFSHADECDSCGDAMRVERFLSRTRHGDGPAVNRLAPASVIWVRAMIERRKGREGEIARRRRQFQSIGWLVVATAWIVFLIFSGAPLIQWIAQLEPSSMIGKGPLHGGGLPPAVLITLAGLCIITATVAVQDALTEA